MSRENGISIFKMNGLGNQIVVADVRDHTMRLSRQHICAIAENPRTPFDQLMVLYQPRTPDSAAFVRIYNTDGSEAEACGNGMRCVARIAGDGMQPMRFETVAGILDVSFGADDQITVNMGRPKFRWDEIPLRDEFHDTTRIELQVGPIDAPVLHSPSVCNIGNPHAVFWVADINDQALNKFGPMLEHHPLFPERANITVAAVVQPDHVLTRTWERGVGLTKACGSAACAVLACGVKTGRLDRKASVSVPGGELTIEWSSDAAGIFMSGPAELEYQGVISVSAAGELTFKV